MPWRESSGTGSVEGDGAHAVPRRRLRPARTALFRGRRRGGAGFEGRRQARAESSYTREDDVRGLSYRPFVMSRVRGGVDAAGMPVAWQQTIVSQGVLRGGWTDAFIPKGQAFDQSSVEGASDMPYDIPNVLVDTHEGIEHGARVVVAFGGPFAHRIHRELRAR